MKQLVVIISFLLLIQIQAFSQEAGLRFGNISGGKIAFDGVYPLGGHSRLHGDVSFGNGVGVDLQYNYWIRPTLNDDQMSWYFGMGPAICFDDSFSLGFAGEVGLEYKIYELPIAISADWRPTFWLRNDSAFKPWKWGVNVRYVFGDKWY